MAKNPTQLSGFRDVDAAAFEELAHARPHRQSGGAQSDAAAGAHHAPAVAILTRRLDDPRRAKNEIEENMRG